MIEPAHLWVPVHVSSAGAEAADFAESAGLVLDAEQRLALNAMLSERSPGRWAALEAAIICPRRNGKTWSIIAAALADLFLFGADTVVWSAHEFKTAMEAYRDIKELVEGASHLSRKVRKFVEANGDEGFELHSGGRMLFKARTKSGGRGLGGDRVILDEAFALKPSMIGSLMPLVATKPNPQIVYASSAGQVDSEILRRLRDRGRAEGDPSLVYVEWCAPVVDCANDRCDHRPRTPGCVLDREDFWQAANPSLGGRIPFEYLRAERASMPPEEFVRERLGWWDEPEGAVAGLPAGLWESREVAGIVANVKVEAVAVDVAHGDKPHTAVAVAGVLSSGDRVVAVSEHVRGTSWVAPYLSGLVKSDAPLVIDMLGPSAVLAEDLSEAGLEPRVIKAREMAQACAAFVDGLVEERWSHLGQASLDAAVAGALRRPLGDAWAWSRKSSSVDISPLVAVTLAAWGAQQPSSAPPDTGLVDLNDYLDDDWFDDER